MPKATGATDSTTPKKRTRKAAAAPEAAGSNGNAAHSAEVVAAALPPKAISEPKPVLEEKIRARAYELYLRRQGRGGSPEQDWFQAVQEICGQHV